MTPILFATLLIANQPTVQLQTLSGENVRGVLTEVTDEDIALETGGGRVVFQTERLTELVVNQPNSPSRESSKIQVKLVDGSSVAATDYMSENAGATLARDSDASINVATMDIATVRFQSQSQDTDPQWSRIAGSKPDTDLLVVRKGDVLDYHGGLVKRVTDALVEFEIDGELIPVKRSKVFGLVFCQSGGRSLPSPTCFVTELDGSRWTACSLRLEDGKLEWTTQIGLEVASSLASIQRVDFSQGKITYLSDLEPEAVQWTPLIGMGRALEVATPLFTLRKDRNLGNHPLRLDGIEYSKGLALHSHTEVVYRLPADSRRFRATVGIDDGVRPLGSVVLVVRGDDTVLIDREVSGSDPPLPIDVNIEGVRRLTIIVGFGKDLDVADHLDLCQARVVK
jgi:hypothetical protein